ncbi:MAG: DUF3575 domain-containing protein [Bacteroidaceae bacterium]|nr:DUF3575 domain-containing protein [Bacteroidaceae bacterium]
MSKRLLFILFLFLPLSVMAQWSLKNNLLYDAALTWNAGVEARIRPQWTLALNAGYSPYQLGTHTTRRWRHLLVMPEARYWFCEPYARHFIGINAVYSHYNAARLNLPLYGTGDFRYQGDFAGLGASYGYAIAIGKNKHWNIELEVGADLCYTWYDKYECEHCGDILGSEDKWFVLPKLGVNLAWVLPHKYFNKERMKACDVVPAVSEPVPALMLVPAFVPSYDFVEDNTGKAGELLKNNPILAHIDTYAPYTPDRIVRKEGNAMCVFFPLDKSDIKLEFRDNQQMLERIVHATRQILADSISDVRKISIIGMASIEGPETHNTDLGEWRAQALKEYIQSHVNVPDSLFDLANGEEAWSEFRDQLHDIRALKAGHKVEAVAGSPAAETLSALTPEVLKGISLNEVDEVLQLIENEADPARREQRIRQVNGGRTYAYLKQTVLADQRNSGYLRIYYDYVPDEAARAINEAIAYLRQERPADALRLLLSQQNDPRAWNAMGVAYYKMGNIRQAQRCFQQAAENGDAHARKNLQQLQEIQKAVEHNRRVMK